MKIRNGFVSNSSSSSFLIAFKKNTDLIKRMEKRGGFGETEVRKLGFSNCAKEYLGYHGEEYFKDVLKNLLLMDRALKNGYDEVAIINVDYCDGEIDKVFIKETENGNVKILERRY